MIQVLPLFLEINYFGSNKDTFSQNFGVCLSKKLEGRRNQISRTLSASRALSNPIWTPAYAPGLPPSAITAWGKGRLCLPKYQAPYLWDWVIWKSPPIPFPFLLSLPLGTRRLFLFRNEGRILSYKLLAMESSSLDMTTRPLIALMRSRRLVLITFSSRLYRITSCPSTVVIESWGECGPACVHCFSFLGNAWLTPKI